MFRFAAYFKLFATTLLLSGIVLIGFFGYKNDPLTQFLLHTTLINDAKVNILINNDISSASKLRMVKLLEPFTDDSFTKIDLMGIAELLKKESWINRFTIKKYWPNKLVIGIIPHYVVARINDYALLTYQGEVIQFNAHSYKHLPQLNFPATEKEHVLYYYGIVKQYISRFSWQITSFTLSEAGTLRIHIQINKNDPDTIEFSFPVEKLTACLNKLDLLLSNNNINFAKVKSINMNYANGFAVSWRVATN